MKKTRFTEEQVIGVLKRAEAGRTVAELCRSEGIIEATFYRWKAQYGRLEVSRLQRLRQLEDELSWPFGPSEAQSWHSCLSTVREPRRME
jgi:putative transposase